MSHDYSSSDGGYEDGYRAVSRFWAPTPGRLVAWLDTCIDWHELDVLDLGCGEGTNAAWMSAHGANVRAVEISKTALEHARRDYPDSQVNWQLGSVADLRFPAESFDIIVAYGLLHCLDDDDANQLVGRMQHWTRGGGFNLIVAFNDRSQDIARAHPNFEPALRPHLHYTDQYSGWEILVSTDEDLTETHPHNAIEHTHSMTRFVARKKP